MISKNINKLFYIKKRSILQHSNSAIKYLITNNRGRLHCMNRNLDSNILHNETLFVKGYNYRNSYSLIKPASLYAEPKTFQGLKINHSYNILTDSEIYSKSLTKPLLFNTEEIENIDLEKLLEKEWISMNIAEILENFKLISYYAFNNNQVLTDTIYQGILEILINKLPNFNDNELHCLMDYLMLWSTETDDPAYRQMIKTLDKECLKRMPNWTTDEILLVNDKFYLLKVPRLVDFTYFSLLKMGRKLKNLNRADLMHFTFLLNVIRHIPLRTYELEYYSERYVDELTVEELGILAIAFIKFKNSFKSKAFILKIVQKLQINLDSISDVALSGILQILKHMPDEDLTKELSILLELLESQIPHRPIQVISRIAEMKKNILIFNPNLILKLAERLEKDIKDAKINDVERIIASLCIFNFKPKSNSLYTIVIDELLSPEKIEESKRFREAFINMTSNLVQVNFYSEKALNVIMDPKYVDESSQGAAYNLNSQYLKIDHCLELDYPQYTGPRLRTDLLEYQKKKYGALKKLKLRRFTQIGRMERFMMDIVETCKIAFGSESVINVNPLLPYNFNENIVVGINPKTNEFIPLAEKFSEKPLGTIMYAPNDGNKWFALVLGSFKNTTRDHTHTATSMLTMQIRHLKCIGYTPIVIQYHEWQTLAEEKEKQKYIMDRLHE